MKKGFQSEIILLDLSHVRKKVSIVASKPFSANFLLAFDPSLQKKKPYYEHNAPNGHCKSHFTHGSLTGLLAWSFIVILLSLRHPTQ